MPRNNAIIDIETYPAPVIDEEPFADFVELEPLPITVRDPQVVVVDNPTRVAERIEDYARRYLLPRNVERFDLADYQRAFVEAIDRVRITSSSTPFMEVIARSRPAPSPARHYRRPVWAITPERIELGYMTHSRISPWGGGDSAFYSQDLPDHGDRVFPMAKRRGDLYLPLAWPTSTLPRSRGREMQHRLPHVSHG